MMTAAPPCFGTRRMAAGGRSIQYTFSSSSAIIVFGAVSTSRFGPSPHGDPPPVICPPPVAALVLDDELGAPPAPVAPTVVAAALSPNESVVRAPHADAASASVAPIH